jgi:hypothetical protein
MTLAIGLDLDGCVYDFVSAHRDFLMGNHPDAGLWPEPDSWNVWEHWPIDQAEWSRSFAAGVAAGRIFAGGWSYAYPGAVQAVVALAERHTIHVVTHRPREAVATTGAWLDKVGLPYTSLTFARDKSTVPVDVMIEDNVDNALACAAAGARALLLDRPWNRTWAGLAGPPEQGRNVYRAKDWDHVATLLAAIDRAEDPGPEPESALQEAQRLVHGNRGDDYGHPADDFTRTGRMWGAILDRDDVPAPLVGLCMAAVKISREVHRPKRDNRVDLAGYAETVEMCRQREEAPT